MWKSGLTPSRAILLLTNLISLSFFPLTMGTIDNSVQNIPYFHSSFTTNHQHHADLNINRYPIYDGSNIQIGNDGYQQPNRQSQSKEASQAVVAVVQAVGKNQQHNQKSSSESIRSNSNNGSGVNRRCTHFENGEMRCTSRGDVLDMLSSIVNQVGGLATQLGGFSGLMGLMGLLGIKGIAGLILPLFCLFLLKFWLILLPLKLLIPIPIITLPIAGRRNLQDTRYTQIEEKVASIFKQFISTDDYVDKILPEQTKTSKMEKFEDSLKKKRPSYKKPTDKSTKTHANKANDQLEK